MRQRAGNAPDLRIDAERLTGSTIGKDGGQTLLTGHAGAGDPAEVVHPDILDINRSGSNAERLCDGLMHGIGRVAKADDSERGGKRNGALDDAAGVAEGEQEGVGRDLFDDAAERQHDRQRAEGVGRAAGADGFLAGDMPAMRKGFVIGAGFEAADAHLIEDVIRAGKRRFKVGGRLQGKAGAGGTGGD